MTMLLDSRRYSRTLALQQLAVLGPSEQRDHLDTLLTMCPDGPILLNLDYCFDAATFFWVVYNPDRWDLRADIPFEWCPLFTEAFRAEGRSAEAYRAYRKLRLADLEVAAELLSVAEGSK